MNWFGKSGRSKIVVSKGWCTPARDSILSAFKPYGIVNPIITETLIEYPVIGPVAIHATIEVNTQAVEWAEYLVLSTGKFKLVSKAHDPGNERWAARRNGVMPAHWEYVDGNKRDGACRHKSGWMQRLMGID